MDKKPLIGSGQGRTHSSVQDASMLVFISLIGSMFVVLVALALG